MTPPSLLRLTDEVRGLLAGMGSALIKSVKARDNWVFAGRAGSADRSLYEKVSEHLSAPARAPFLPPLMLKVSSALSTCQTAVKQEKTNVYEGWPGQVEVGGCYPLTHTHKT